MKKIFIPLTILLMVGLSTPSYSRWGATFSHGNPHGNNSWFSADSDGYWLNKLRSYKKYPINFYSQRLLNKGSGEKKQQIEAREYERGVAVTARLGQRMYDSSTYTLTTRTGGEHYKALMDGTISNAQNEVNIKQGQIFTPLGEIKVNGQYYILLPFPDSSYVAAVDYKGYFLDALGLIEDGFLYIPKDIAVVIPHDLKVELYKKVEEDTSDTELNFEIKYGGIQGDEMSFLVSDGKNAEYDQRQFVPLGENFIQVNNVNFEIIYASPDYIEYKILDLEPEQIEEEAQQPKQ